MLEKLTLTNFRKHEDLVLDFVAGLNVVRGQNEAGKSTLQEAVGYALFGSKALRTNFADTVTWGRPEGSMRVELSVNIGGRRITFSRGKSGAEALEDGRVIVTGQNEVSTYAANLLGCDGTAAANLMIASQNAMRGSLEQGPKATAAMIEQLADFDLFDVLIERIQSNLVVGAPATFEARVIEARAQLDSFVPAPAPDVKEHTAKIAAKAAAAKSITDHLDGTLRPALRAAEKAKDEVNLRVKAHGEAQAELVQAEKTQASHVAQHDEFLRQAEELESDPAVLEAARQDLAKLEASAEAVALYKLFKTLPDCAHEFEGNEEAFSNWLDGRRADLQATKDKRTEALTKVRVLEASLIASSTCGFCGQDVSAFPDVAKKNAETTAEIVRLRGFADGLAANLPEIEAEIAAGRSIETAFRQAQPIIYKLLGSVNVDRNFVPHHVTWIGEPPAIVDPAPARAEVARLEREAAQRAQLTAKAEAMASILVDDAAHVERTRVKAASYPLPADADTLLTAHIDAREAVWATEGSLQAVEREAAQIQQAYNQAQAVYDARKGEQERLAAAVARAQKDLDDLAFNNTLLKKVRAARPVIADKLWNTVLAAVSTMFSQMRGESSVVSKDNGGFKVNGQPIEALSGSTLDILGLAIRTALVKTFIPHAPFMLLDEAAAACDEDRTGSLLGFVAGSGFEQVVLVTHESASEAVADNVIQL